MPSIENIAAQKAEEQEEFKKEEYLETDVEGGQEESSNTSSIFKTILTTKTGPGSIDQYIDKPLNFNGSKWMARILRGVAGFTDALDLAFLDIGVGLFEAWKGRARNESAENKPPIYTR